MKKMPGFGKREFFALKPEIEKMLEQHYTKQEIYNKFKADGRLSMSYAMLCNYLNTGESFKDVKREFLEVICEVRSLLDKGYNKSMIHVELTKRGLISCCYDSLVRKIREYNIDNMTLQECVEKYGNIGVVPAPAAQTTKSNSLVTRPIMSMASPHKKMSFSEEIEKKKRERGGQ